MATAGCSPLVVLQLLLDGCTRLVQGLRQLLGVQLRVCVRLRAPELLVCSRVLPFAPSLSARMRAAASAGALRADGGPVVSSKARCCRTHFLPAA